MTEVLIFDFSPFGFFGGNHIILKNENIDSMKTAEINYYVFSIRIDLERSKSNLKRKH